MLKSKQTKRLKTQGVREERGGEGRLLMQKLLWDPEAVGDSALGSK